MESDKMQIDYNLLPHSGTGTVALVCTIVGLVFMAVCMYLIYKQGSEPQLNATATAACAMLWSVAGVFFAWRGLKVKNRNYTFCYIAFAVSGIQLMTWIITIIITSRK